MKNLRQNLAALGYTLKMPELINNGQMMVRRKPSKDEDVVPSSQTMMKGRQYQGSAQSMIEVHHVLFDLS